MANGRIADRQSIWQTNVGTQEHPVSYLHEYAVAMIWEALHTSSAVYICDEDGGLSCNLKEGMARVDIPDATTAIAGSIPDLAIYDENHRPIRVIEVEYTNKPNPDKLVRLNNLGIDVVIARVHNQARLFSLIRTEGELNKEKRTYRSHANLAIARSGGRLNAKGQRVDRMVSKANETIKGFMDALAWCSPELRREFCEMMFGQDGLRGIHALYPISSLNPKYEALRNARDRS